MTRNRKILVGLLTSVAFALLWHGPLGAADRFATRVEGNIRLYLVRDEMAQVHARLVRNPLSRTIILSGPADDFQHDELARRVRDAPGVVDVRWDPASPPVETPAK